MSLALIVIASISCTLSSNVKQNLKINTASLENVMTIKGEFKISMIPQEDGDFEAGRSTLDKKYYGDLEGTGKG